MSRQIRNKSSNSKSNNNNENGLMTEERLNGSSSSAQLVSPSIEINKKRHADMIDSSNDQFSDDCWPPNKKRSKQDVKMVNANHLKRSMSVLDDESHINAKNMKLEHVCGFNKRIWQACVSPTNQIHNQNCSDNLPHFIIATYNISRDSQASNGNTCHAQLMQELEFINADVLCLQQVEYSYWKESLECSLKDRGYVGDFVVGDNMCNFGVATLYQTSRFTILNVDSNKLSKLCIEQISSDSGLDKLTLDAIQQYIDEPSPYMVTVLRDNQIDDGRLLIVGNTHLSGTPDDKCDLQCVQVVGLFWRIHQMIRQIMSDLTNNNGARTGQLTPPCWILCGDFSCSVDSPVYQICRDGYPNERSIEQLQAMRNVSTGATNKTASLIDLIWHRFQHPLTNLCSSYLNVANVESNKDYIWMSEDALKPSRVLMPCSSEFQRGTTGDLVHAQHPSDNISLACEVAFV